MKSESERPRGPESGEASGAAGNPDRTVLDWPRRIGGLDYFRAAIAGRLRRRRRLRLQVALGSAAALIVAGFVWHATSSRSAPAAIPALAPAIVSLPARQTLPDGSVVELRDGARISVAFDDALRRVVLESGEAHFQVTKNKTRPFVVSAAGVEVRAVGTAFDVEIGGQDVAVLVTEGRVAVEKPLRRDETVAGSLPLALVDAGHRIVVSVAGKDGRQPEIVPAVLPVSVSELAEKLAWRAPRLEFSGTPLAEVIAMINQHGKIRLVLGDPELSKVELSGVLRADNVETLLRMLDLNYGIKAERRDGGEIILHQAR